MTTLVRVDCRVRRLKTRGSVRVGMEGIWLKSREDLGVISPFSHGKRNFQEEKYSIPLPPRIILKKARSSHYK